MISFGADKQRELRYVFPTHLPPLSLTSAGLLNSLAAYDRKFPAPFDCFGMDQKVQFFLEVTTGWKTSRKAFYRIPQEPILMGYWSRLATFDFSPDLATKYVSLLRNESTSLRNGEIWSTDKNGNKTYFEEFDPLFSWVSSLKDIRKNGYDPLVEAILCYSRLIFYHPFEDGNGRFARAMFYGSLARHKVLRSPCLGIGAGFDRFAEDIASLNKELSISSDWGPYLAGMLAVIRKCYDIADKVS